MKIGLSLPLGYLSGSTETPDERVFLDVYGPPTIGLETLQDQGVNSIEIGGIRARTSAEATRMAAERVMEAGLGLTLHGYLPDPVVGDDFATIFPPLAPIIDLLGKKRAETVLTLHCYRAGDGEMAALKTSTMAFLQRVGASLERIDTQVRLALETTRKQGRVDPGSTYHGLLEMRAEAGQTAIGFCWDFGHSYWNVSRARQDRPAPPRFVAGVIHTHLHDLAPDGQTHWPLTEESAPLGVFAEALQSAHYEGVYNLELYPSRWSAVRDVRESILTCIEIVRGWTRAAGITGH